MTHLADPSGAPYIRPDQLARWHVFTDVVVMSNTPFTKKKEVLETLVERNNPFILLMRAVDALAGILLASACTQAHTRRSIKQLQAKVLHLKMLFRVCFLLLWSR